MRGWDLEKLQPLAPLKAEISQIFALELWADRGLLVAAGNDQRVQLFDPRAPGGHPRFARLAAESYFAVSPQSSLKAAGYRELLHSAGAEPPPERSAGLCYFGCGGGLVETWDLRAPTARVAGAGLFAADVRGLELDPSGGYLLCATLGRDLALLRASTLQKVEQLAWHRERALSAEWHPFFPLIASASEQGVKLAHSTLFSLPQPGG